MKLSDQMKRRSVNSNKLKRQNKYDGDISHLISTGSTLLDLAISGGRSKYGGVPAGILVEIFGPSGSGKTVLLTEMAGAIKRKGGHVMFKDPEARLNNQFAKIFDLDVDQVDYDRPDTVTEVFDSLRDWKPEGEGTHGIFADSVAALSTKIEMEKEDKMGMRRAKEFSEGLRKTCRILADKNYLLVVSNQVRENLDAGPYGQKWKTPGGVALEFYSSLRLRMVGSTKIVEKKKVHAKEVKRVKGITTTIEVAKSSVWSAFRTAPVTILFDYGIDDIRANLQFIKDHTNNKVYTIGSRKLGQSMDASIKIIEEEGLERKLKAQVVRLWNEIETKFKSERKPKRRV